MAAVEIAELTTLGCVDQRSKAYRRMCKGQCKSTSSLPSGIVRKGASDAKIFRFAILETSSGKRHPELGRVGQQAAYNRDCAAPM